MFHLGVDPNMNLERKEFISAKQRVATSAAPRRMRQAGSIIQKAGERAMSGGYSGG